MEKSLPSSNKQRQQTRRVQLSYHTALSRHRDQRGIARVSWVTWLVTALTVAIWLFTAYQVALLESQHSLAGIWHTFLNNDENVDVLVRYGAKDNDLLRSGQYWRLLTPIFLHANLLHMALNMFNFVFLGFFLERLLGHLRFLYIYLLTGIISIIASAYFMPNEVSVGASGAIFGLVGVYCVFVVSHRRAFLYNGIPTLLWLVIIIGINLSIGLFIPNVDNYAHIAGFCSGCLLGWWFAPSYRPPDRELADPESSLSDAHSLARRWPIALLAIIGTFVLAVIVIHLIGG